MPVVRVARMLVFVAVLTAGCGGASDPPDGAAIFRDRCSACHGAEGLGGMGPALRGQATDDIVKQGRLPQGMPAFDEILSDAEIDAVVEYANRLNRLGS